MRLPADIEIATEELRRDATSVTDAAILPEIAEARIDQDPGQEIEAAVIEVDMIETDLHATEEADHQEEMIAIVGIDAEEAEAQETQDLQETEMTPDLIEEETLEETEATGDQEETPEAFHQSLETTTRNLIDPMKEEEIDLPRDQGLEQDLDLKLLAREDTTMARTKGHQLKDQTDTPDLDLLATQRTTKDQCQPRCLALPPVLDQPLALGPQSLDQ